jgi:hypothetical protein
MKKRKGQVREDKGASKKIKAKPTAENNTAADDGTSKAKRKKATKSKGQPIPHETKRYFLNMAAQQISYARSLFF